MTLETIWERYGMIFSVRDAVFTNTVLVSDGEMSIVDIDRNVPAVPGEQQPSSGYRQ